MKYTVGRESMDDPYHIDIIKEKLTRTLPAVLPEVIDELKLAVDEHIPTQDDSESTTSCGCSSLADNSCRVDHRQGYEHHAADRRAC